MTDFPRSLIEFQQRFADEAACVRYLFAARWPEGFVCPDCGTSKAWELQTKAWTPTQAGGISALQLQRQLDLGSYKTA
jgi:hypothetical protein